MDALTAPILAHDAVGAVHPNTDADTLPKPPWRARKEAYLVHLETENPDALLVSAADKLHNARAIVSDLRTHGPAVFERFRAGRDGTLWYYRALADAFTRRMPGPLSRDLDAAVAEMEALAARAASPTRVDHSVQPV